MALKFTSGALMKSNAMIEKHPFGYFLPTNADKLIIGSFPCFNGVDYGDWFYNGSGKNEFWKLLSEIFNQPSDTKEDKEKICQANGIAITDIALKIRRIRGNCSDSNLEILEVNKETIQNCLNNGITRIYFTSKFVEKQFNKYFPNNDLQTFVLLSPSPMANIYIAGMEEYKTMKKTNEISSPYEFRLLKYKVAFDYHDH